MKLAQLLVFRLRLDRGARFRFFHNPTVYAYLMDRLGTPPTFPTWVSVVPALSRKFPKVIAFSPPVAV